MINWSQCVCPRCTRTRTPATTPNYTVLADAQHSAVSAPCRSFGPAGGAPRAERGRRPHRPSGPPTHAGGSAPSQKRHSRCVRVNMLSIPPDLRLLASRAVCTPPPAHPRVSRSMRPVLSPRPLLIRCRRRPPPPRRHPQRQPGPRGRSRCTASCGTRRPASTGWKAPA